MKELGVKERSSGGAEKNASDMPDGINECRFLSGV
jgi:hypothetical protein